MKKVLLLVSLLSIGQVSFAAVLHVANKSKQPSLPVTIVWGEGGKRKRDIPKANAGRGERTKYYTLDSGFNPIQGVQWLDAGKLYFINISISTASIRHKLQIGADGLYSYDEGEIRQAKEDSDLAELLGD